jgi:N-acetylmuramoyl-L-alanine amidase
MKITENYLTPNPFSRPKKNLIGVKGIVIHWVGNPQTTAAQNRNYFESLKNQNSAKDPVYASAHFLIGLQGEIIQCLVESETAYHVGAKQYNEKFLKKLSAYPNNCTIGIELCHIDWEGKFTSVTLSSAKELIHDLCGRYDLECGDIYRHFDITGKNCPLYFVKHQQKWDDFLRFILS